MYICLICVPTVITFENIVLALVVSPSAVYVVLVSIALNTVN